MTFEKIVVVGVNSLLNKVEDKHILMLDYDDYLAFETLKDELHRLQAEYHLGRAWVIETSRLKYSVFFFEDVLPYIECIDIIRHTSCDPKFKRARMIYDELTIRLSVKNGSVPRLIEIIEPTYPHSRRVILPEQEAFMRQVSSCLK